MQNTWIDDFYKTTALQLKKVKKKKNKEIPVSSLAHNKFILDYSEL